MAGVMQQGFARLVYLIQRAEAPPQSPRDVSHQAAALRPAFTLLLQQQVLQTFLRRLLMRTRQFVKVEPENRKKREKYLLWFL